MLCWVLDGDTVERLGPTRLAEVLRAGVDWLQLRDRQRDGGALLELVDVACQAARAVSDRSRVLVNRRVDAALAAGADGVHLGFDALPASRARDLLGPDALVGISAHDPGEPDAAPDADYAHLAPIFPPLSKPGERPPLGIETLRRACDGGVPLLAQGGIDPSTARAVIDAGAAGVAVTGLLSGASDPRRSARELRETLDA